MDDQFENLRNASRWRRSAFLYSNQLSRDSMTLGNRFFRHRWRRACRATAMTALIGLGSCGLPESTVINNIFDAANRRPVRSQFLSLYERTERSLERRFPDGSPAADLIAYIETAGGECLKRIAPGVEDEFEHVQCGYENITYSIRDERLYLIYYETIYSWGILVIIDGNVIVDKIITVGTRGSEELSADEYFSRLRAQNDTGREP